MSAKTGIDLSLHRGRRRARYTLLGILSLAQFAAAPAVARLAHHGAPSSAQTSSGAASAAGAVSGQGMSAAQASARDGLSAFDFMTPIQIADVKSRKAAIDVTAALQAGIDATAATGGGSLRLPPGRYRLSGSLSLSGRNATMIVGASRMGTELVQTINAPVVVDTGTSTAVDRQNGIESLAIHCSGMTGSHAHGISFTYANSNIVRDVYLRGCNHALDMNDQWQTLIDHVDVEGAGVDQSSVGIYGGGPTDASDRWGNNALIISNVRLQHLATYGIRMIQPAGSKIVNSEIADAGVTGIYLCGEALAQADNGCHFVHMSNVLVDSVTGIGIDISQGRNKNPVSDMQFDNLWIGSTSQYALHVQGGKYLTFRAVHIASAQNGISIQKSSYITIDADLRGINRTNDNSFALRFDGVDNSSVRWTAQSDFRLPGYNGFVETASNASNQLFGGLAPCSAGLSFGGDSSGMTFTASRCEYQVLGQEVHLHFALALSAKGSSTGPAAVTGLPFAASKNTAAPNYEAVQPVLASSGFTGLAGSVLSQVVGNSTKAELVTQGPSGVSHITDSMFTNSSILSGEVSYFRR